MCETLVAVRPSRGRGYTIDYGNGTIATAPGFPTRNSDYSSKDIGRNARSHNDINIHDSKVFGDISNGFLQDGHVRLYDVREDERKWAFIVDATAHGCKLHFPRAQYPTVVHTRYTKFNNIDISGVEFNRIFHNTDHVVIKKKSKYYNTVRFDANPVGWHAFSIEIPRRVDRKIKDGDHWVTHGLLRPVGDEQFVDTLITASESKDTILVRVPDDVFVEAKSPSAESLVLVRCEYKGDISKAWTDVTVDANTQWVAKTMVSVCNLRDGVGWIVRDYTGKVTAVMANGFGYVYVPPNVEETCSPLESAKKYTRVKFTARRNEDMSLIKSYTFKWRAITMSVCTGADTKAKNSKHVAWESPSESQYTKTVVWTPRTDLDVESYKRAVPKRRPERFRNVDESDSETAMSCSVCQHANQLLCLCRCAA